MKPLKEDLLKKNSYSEKLKDPRWQRRRLQILDRANFTCEECEASTKTLHVHHLYYVSGREPWEYPDFALLALCHDCHSEVPMGIETRRREELDVLDEWEIALQWISGSGNRLIGSFDFGMPFMALQSAGYTPIQSVGILSSLFDPISKELPDILRRYADHWVMTHPNYK